MSINGINNNYLIKSNYVNTKKMNKPQCSKPSFKGEPQYYDPIKQREKYKAEFKNSLDKRKEDLRLHLDKITVNMNGKEGSVTDVLKSFFPNEKKSVSYENMHHRTMRENVDGILNNGFDFSKINQTEYGPGIYFGSESAIQIYSGETLKASFRGNVSDSFGIKNYNTLKSNLISEVRNYLGLGFSDVDKMLTECEVIGSEINDYCRKKIVDELGIDGAVATERGYFVVFNPDSIVDVKRA